MSQTWYAQGANDSDPSSIDSAIAAVRAAHPGDKILAYWPRQAWSRVPVGASWVGVEAYQLLGESDATFEARVRAAMARCAIPWLIVQCFTSNATLTTNLRGVAVVCARIARDTGCSMLMFNGSGRATGLQDHPEMLPVWRALFASMTAQPATPTPLPTPVKKPKEPPVSTDATPDHFINVEFPQISAQSVTSGLGVPDPSMVAFITLRRFGFFPGEVWSFARLMADLVAQGQANGSIPKEAP
jgi:hypothetical protein